MSRRLVLLGLLALVPAGCGRRGRLRLPEREGGGTGQGPALPRGSEGPVPPPSRPARERRGPLGLETG